MSDRFRSTRVSALTGELPKIAGVNFSRVLSPGNHVFRRAHSPRCLHADDFVDDGVP